MSGLKIEAVYSDDSVEEITEGYEVTGYASDREGSQTITVTYGGKTAEFQVTVTAKPEKTLASIRIAERPAKTAYETGEELELSGLKIEAVYSDDSVEEITEGYEVTGYASDREGSQTITVTYGGKTAEFQVTVTAEPEKITVTKLAAPTKVKASCAGTGSIKISWKKVAGAEKYQVYRKSGKKWKKAATVTGTSYTNKKLSCNKKYQFRVRAVVTSGSLNSYGDYSKTVKGMTGPEKVTGLKLKKLSRTSYQISWEKVPKAGRYDIYQKKGKGSYKKLKSVNAKTLKYTVKGLKKGQSFQFYVKAVRKSGKTSYAGSPAYTKKVKIK